MLFSIWESFVLVRISSLIILASYTDIQTNYILYQFLYFLQSRARNSHQSVTYEVTSRVKWKKLLYTLLTQPDIADPGAIIVHNIAHWYSNYSILELFAAWKFESLQLRNCFKLDQLDQRMPINVGILNRCGRERRERRRGLHLSNTSDAARARARRNFRENYNANSSTLHGYTRNVHRVHSPARRAVTLDQSRRVQLRTFDPLSPRSSRPSVSVIV